VPRFSLIVIFGLVSLLCGLSSVASAAPVADNAPAEPIHIEADRMESDQRSEAVTFAGNVEAVQGDLVIKADQMTVNYRKEAASSGAGMTSGQSIESLKATGNIMINKQDWRASGEKMDYETVGRKVILTGNTKVWRGSNMVSGDRVVLYLDEGKSVVEDQDKETGGRVKAFFYPTKTIETKKEQQPEK